MIISRARAAAASLLTRGRVEPVAREVQVTLETGNAFTGRDAIDRIVAHAARNVPYYRELRTTTLEELPVMDKTTMRDRPEAFFSAGADREKLGSASTSGSTGMPFTAYFDAGKVLRHRGGLVGTYRFMGAEPYGPIVHNRHWPAMGRRQLLLFAAKGQLPYAGTHHDSRSVEDVAAWIRRRRGVAIMGYASYIESLLRAFEDRGLEFSAGQVRAVIAGSEPATDYLSTGAQRLFGLAPHMRYSNMENGMLGVTDTNPDIYHLDTSSFYIEILEEESDDPVAPGQQGRVVVTDLHNRAMPFLRYDTGDLGRFPLDAGGNEQRNKLTGIKGRRLEVLVAGTEDAPRRAHPLQIWGATARITGLRQFQLRQHAVGSFTWVLNTEKSAETEARLRAILDENVGDIRECRFAYVDEVPVMASGKRRFFVNEIPDADKPVSAMESRR